MKDHRHSDDFAFATFEDWWRWRHPPQEQWVMRDDVPTPCEMCGGTGWASYPDPFFDGVLIDARCPLCCDTTVRAKKRRWEGDNGQRSGPR